MTNSHYIQSIIKANTIQDEDRNELKSLVEKYPYFHAARALYLKTLKNNESFRYNNELKITAAYTTDRKVLFDFITSSNFQKSNKKKKRKISTKGINILSQSKETKIDKAIKELSIGKPIVFTKSESFSFNQWLDLSSKKLIVRESEINQTPKKKPQDSIIDKFIENTPKISRPSKLNTSSFKPAEMKEDTQLMTETLAKVYLEQKKYDSAITAYKILSLKYPEKSGFFADQVKKIKILQNNK
ncbi:hypothetical protein SAMN04489761_4199 [Tenacibaculum sp. MAR_2009_124]|uniref:hypothetical protein n=1 Tax=Tenacibaculum sp. MAR_2009_124 TaxID=1250059 RepID=UPI000896B154|nr:hypothetical protein [Tenacibaculum sp. MAR_2009_124]SED07776.1 hypothetical protein SAMN04489761_4199 [Tenacibaculum sp. MAR_2009_124]